MNEQTLNYLKDGSQFFMFAISYVFVVAMICIIGIIVIITVWFILESLVRGIKHLYKEQK